MQLFVKSPQPKAASVTLDPDTIRLLRSLTLYVRPTLLSHTEPIEMP